MSESNRFDQAIEDLLADRSPRTVAPELNPEEQAMMQMAQFLRGSQTKSPKPEFVTTLHERLFPRRQVSRRTAFLSGVSALAAGLAAGIGLPRLGSNSSKHYSDQPIIGTANPRGQWFPIAAVAAVPEGAVVAFTAGAVQGFVLNTRGEYRAISRICTHMGCALKFEQSDQALQCPCHGAEFDLQGHMLIGPGGYTHPLPPLPRLEVRVRNRKIEVLSA